MEQLQEAVTKNVIFSAFPLHPENYSEDTQKIMTEVIGKYGLEEWKTVVLTNEIHGHLGIYAIVGAKMGLLAREYLGISHDEVSIISHAGTKPPLSCLNDGLQVSTGATIGHGLFTVNADPTKSPSAVFQHHSTIIRIALKSEIWQKIEQDIKNALLENDGLTPGYWKEIRRLGLIYWLEFDRNQIFNISEIK